MHLKQALLLASLSVSMWAQAPAAPDPRKVVATVGGKDVTAAEIEQMLATFDPQMMQTFQQNPTYMIGQYFLFIHLADEAEKEKLLEKSPFKEQYQRLRLQLLGNARVNDENNTYAVSTEMIESYYKQHIAQYEQAKIKVVYIPFAGQVVPTGTSNADLEKAAKAFAASSQSKRSEADAKKLAETVVAELHGGADFGKMVEQYSEDSISKASGGFFPAIKAVSEYPADLKAAVFALKPGEISAPIRQPTAYYVVRLEEKGPQPLPEVQESIIQTIRNEHMNQWMKDLNASYQAVIKDSDFFKTAGAPPPVAPLAPKPK